MNKETLIKLIEKAEEAMNNAYVPRSNFPVGAAVLTTKGKIYTGCNVESVISGMGTCAERNAVDSAVAHGEYKFTVVVVVSNSVEPIALCGMCLQYINEFAQVGKNDIKLFMIGNKRKVIRSSVRKMLPSGFGPRNLGLDLTKYEKS